MEPYEHSELGGVGEGLRVIEGTQPLTQLRVTSYACGFGANSAQPSPTGEGKVHPISAPSTTGLLSLVPR
jgi:hypothetical protein